jgi:hypothetical protein
LYIAGNPYKKSSPWQAICSTREELDEVIKTLDPTPPFPMEQLAGKKAGKKARKAVDRDIPRWVMEERLLRHRLSITPFDKGKERMDEIQHKRELYQKKRMRDARKQAAIEEARARIPLTRSSRLRTKPNQADYVYAEDADDASFDQDLATFNGLENADGMFDDGDQGAEAPRKRRRRQSADEETWIVNGDEVSDGDEEYNENEDDGEDLNLRASTRRSRAAKQATTGGRRSSRLQTQQQHSSDHDEPYTRDTNRRSTTQSNGSAGQDPENLTDEGDVEKEEGVDNKMEEVGGDGESKKGDGEEDGSLVPSLADHSSTPSPPSPLTASSVGDMAE